MRVPEAKDFLVQQTAEQAQLEGVPLSDLEKRMMYFTEGKDAIEDPTALNDEFEAQYDSAKFEKKISRLMRDAHKRLKKEDSEKTTRWNNAIRKLRAGDHYILVLSREHLNHGTRHYWRFLAVMLVPWVLLQVFLFLFSSQGRLVPHSTPYLHYLPLPGPITFRVLQVLFWAVFFAAILFPRIFGPLNRYVYRLFDWIIGEDKKGAEIEH